MKFSTSKTELQQALQKLSKATPTRSTLPILGCALIDAGNEKTVLKTTDLEISIQVEIPSSLEKSGQAAIPLKTLLEVTNELPEVRLTIEVDDKNKATISTDLGQYDLMAKRPDEFPKTPEQKSPTSIKVPGKTLKHIIDSTSFAISRDELKPALTGVLLQIKEDKTVAVSTDGHRLVKQTRGDFGVGGTTADIIVPKKFLNYLSSHLKDGEVELLLAEDHLAAKVGSDVIITRIIDESFPNYESVIPKENNKRLIVEKSALLGAIKRVSIFSNKSTHQVALSLGVDGCKITTEDPEKSSKAQENIAATYEGDPIVIGYNAEYLKDVVSHIDGDEVAVDLSSPVSAALFSSLQSDEKIESIMLLMPIRLND
jgi:DNA polymerase-3 subunit beta